MGRMHIKKPQILRGWRRRSHQADTPATTPGQQEELKKPPTTGADFPH